MPKRSERGPKRGTFRETVASVERDVAIPDSLSPVFFDPAGAPLVDADSVFPPEEAIPWLRRETIPLGYLGCGELEIEWLDCSTGASKRKALADRLGKPLGAGTAGVFKLYTTSNGRFLVFEDRD